MADNVPAVATNGSTDMVTALLMRAATDPSFDADKFKVAVDFLRERETRAGHRAFNEAMSRASGEMQDVPKDASNDYLRSRYATLPGMLAVIKPITAQNGLAFRFGTLPHVDPDWMTVTLILSLGDHEEITALPGPILSGEGTRGGKTQMNNLQAVGGTVTYLSRYLLGMVFSLIQHMPDIAQDNDGGDPTRGSRRETPPSHPPHQAGRESGVQQATGGATAGNANGRPDPTAARLARLETLLTGCKTPDDVAEVMGRDGVKQWRDGAAEATKKAIDVMSAAAVARLTPPTKSPEQQALEDALNRRPATPPESTPAEPAQPPASTALVTLLMEIAQANQAALDELPTNPAFNKAVLNLSFPEQDRIDAAIQARAAELAPST